MSQMAPRDEKSRIKRICEELNLPSGRWVVNGSGSMVMHGMDRKPRDLDVFVATQTWFSLYSLPASAGWDVFVTDPDDPMRRCDPPYLYRVVEGLEVNVFSEWRKRGVGDINVAFIIHNAVVVDDVPCVPLQMLLDWKVETGRQKDLVDIRAIRAFMATQS